MRHRAPNDARLQQRVHLGNNVRRRPALACSVSRAISRINSQRQRSDQQRSVPPTPARRQVVENATHACRNRRIQSQQADVRIEALLPDFSAVPSEKADRPIRSRRLKAPAAVSSVPQCRETRTPGISRSRAQRIFDAHRSALSTSTTITSFVLPIHKRLEHSESELR